MQLHTNSIASNSVREVTENGTTYLVAEDVTLGKPMYLDNGYVSEESWRESAERWDGQPAPIGHPTDASGNVISAQLNAVQQHAVIGDIRDTYYSEEDDGLNGDIWVDVGKAEKLGGLAADVPELLRNGNPLEVSTAYYSDPGEPGEYDGEYHENVRENLRPDHVALLPGPLGPGRCSRAEDGCGVPPNEGVVEDGSVTADADADTPQAIAANGVAFSTNGDGAGLVISEQAAEGDLQPVGAGMSANVLSESRTPTYSGTESSSWEDVSKTFDNFLNAVSDPPDDAAGVEDLNQSQRREMAETSLLGDADGDSFDEVVFFPVVNPSTGSLNEGALEAVIGGRGSSADIAQSAIDSAQSTARRLLNEEFDRDLDSNDTMQSNQTEGDRVRWESSNGNWRYGIVVDEADSSQEVADDEVLIAVYVNETDGWTRSDETVTVEEDELEVIDQFPAEAMSGNILSEARSPEYEDTVDADGSGDEFLFWSLEDYLDAYYDEQGEVRGDDPYSPLSGVPEGFREWAADHTLLGNPSAESEANLLMMEVVSPAGKLYEEKLLDVLGSDGGSETIPEEQRESAREVARDLLESEFGYSLSENQGSVPFPSDDLPDVNGDSESFWSGMFSAFSDFVRREQSANSTETDGPDVAETDGGHSESGCECGGECADCSSDESESDTHAHTQPGDSETDADDGEAAATGTDTESESDTADASSADTTTNTTMSFDDSDYERLAENSAWDEDELRANDAVAEKVAETVDAQAQDDNEDDGEDENGESESEVETETETEDVEVTSDDTADEDIPAWAEDLRSTVESQDETIEELRSQLNEQKEAERAEKKEAILANSETFTESMLDSLNDEDFETAYENAVPEANHSPTGTDFAALNQPSAHINTDPAANSEDNEDVGPASSGSFADYMAANESGD